MTVPTESEGSALKIATKKLVLNSLLIRRKLELEIKFVMLCDVVCQLCHTPIVNALSFRRLGDIRRAIQNSDSCICNTASHLLYI